MSEFEKKSEIDYVKMEAIKERMVACGKKAFPKTPNDFLVFVKHEGNIFSSIVKIEPDDRDNVLDIKPIDIKKMESNAQILGMINSRFSKMPVVADKQSSERLDQISYAFRALEEEKDPPPYHVRLIRNRGRHFYLYEVPLK